MTGITIGSGAYALAFDGTDKVWVTHYRTDGRISKTIVAEVAAGSRPWGLARDTVNGCMWVANSNNSSTTVILDGSANTSDEYSYWTDTRWDLFYNEVIYLMGK